MPELTFVLAGQEAAIAADRLTAALTEGEAVAVHRSEVGALSGAERKAVDPIALAALIVSIPGAVLTVMDIADRIRKRRKAQAVIDAAKHLRAEKQVDIYLLASAGHRPLVADLDPDRLLDLVKALDPPPTKPE